MVATLLTFGISSLWGSLLSGRHYFRGVTTVGASLLSGVATFGGSLLSGDRYFRGVATFGLSLLSEL